MITAASCVTQEAKIVQLITLKVETNVIWSKRQCLQRKFKDQVLKITKLIQIISVIFLSAMEARNIGMTLATVSIHLS